MSLVTLLVVLPVGFFILINAVFSLFPNAIPYTWSVILWPITPNSYDEYGPLSLRSHWWA